MTVEILPNEILVKIFELLNVGDLLTANLVCRKWNDAASVVIEEKVCIMGTDDIDIDLLKDSVIQYKYWHFKNIDINYRGPFAVLWEQFAEHVKSLSLNYVDISEKDLLNMLQKCCNLEHLFLSGFSQVLMTGTFIESKNDLTALQESFQSVRSFHLSCPRYLTDAIFSRFGSVVGRLRHLSLCGCQISYQNSIWKRFYPPDGSVKASEHVLTYKFIQKFIEANKETLKSLDLGRTSIDSDSLGRLSQVPGLRLEALRLESCDQLTKTGIQVLTQYQTSLVELDVGLCSRLTDYAVMAVTDNLPRLKSLNVRRCQGITEIGLEHLSRLQYLEKLDISHLDVKKYESIHTALGKLHRPSMVWLSVASMPIQWETVLALGDTMPNLRHLDLSMCVMGVQDRSIQAICRSMVKLEVLLLSGCSAVSDIGLSGHSLGHEEALPSAEVGGVQLSLEALGIKEKDPFRIPLGSKEEQRIRQEAEVKRFLEDNMMQIVMSSEFGLKNLPGLKRLNLCGCIRLSDITLCYAIQFRELTYLNLSHCQQINEEGLIQVCKNCPSLEELFLADCGNITDKVILVLSHKTKRIKTLDLQKCSLLTNDSLDSLSSCRSLRYLDVSQCTKMTLDGVYALKKKIPRLLNFHHRGISSVDEEDEEPEMGIRKGHKKIPSPPPLLARLVKKIKS